MMMKKKEIKELTRAEEQIMQILWKLEKAFVKEIVDEMEEPKPAYNTVSTIIRILEKKEYVTHKSYGKSHRYYPLMSRDEYRSQFFSGFLSRFFSGSFKQLVSAFSEEEDMSISEMESLKKIIEDKIKDKTNE